VRRDPRQRRDLDIGCHATHRDGHTENATDAVLQNGPPPLRNVLEEGLRLWEPSGDNGTSTPTGRQARISGLVGGFLLTTPLSRPSLQQQTEGSGQCGSFVRRVWGSRPVWSGPARVRAGASRVPSGWSPRSGRGGAVSSSGASSAGGAQATHRVWGEAGSGVADGRFGRGGRAFGRGRTGVRAWTGRAGEPRSCLYRLQTASSSWRRSPPGPG